MQLVDLERAPAKFVVTQQDWNAFAHRRDQAVVNRDRDVIVKERSFERARKISRARAEHVRFHRIRERGSERVLVVLELGVELLERAPANFAIAFQKKRAVGALRER